MNEMNPRAVIGGNAPPVYRADVVEAHTAKAHEFLDAAGAWLDLKEITDEGQAGRLADFVAGVRAVAKAVDTDRTTDKKPHDDAGKAVQAAYTPILDKLKRAIEKVEPLQRAWLQKVRARQEAEAEAKRREAEAAAAAAAEQARMAAARNDIAGEVEAEAAAKRAADLQKEAERAEKARAQVTSASGGARTQALRTIKDVRITNARLLFLAVQDEPEVQDALLRVARRIVRAKDFTGTLAGVDIFETEKAV